MRAILEAAISAHGALKLGSLLADMGRQARLNGDEFAVFEQVRDKARSRAVSFQ